MTASTTSEAPMMALKTRWRRGSVSRRRIATPNSAHIDTHGMPTAMAMALTNAAAGSTGMPGGMKTVATVMALTQLLGLTA